MDIYENICRGCGKHWDAPTTIDPRLCPACRPSTRKGKQARPSAVHRDRTKYHRPSEKDKT